MFKRENRLVSGIRFRGRPLFSNLQLTIKENKNSFGLNRFGVVVSKKVEPKAVSRNKIKRAIRTAALDLSEKMSLGHDILIIVKKGFAKVTKQEALILLEKIFTNAGIILK